MTPLLIQTWQDVESIHSKLRAVPSARWIFRGLRDFEWGLRPKLERVLQDRFKIALTDATTTERRLIREFKRHLHRYTPDLPDDNDDLRWLALMQHHGAPTRLLDFTYSFFVGLFFAMETAKPSDHCALWAINHDWLWNKAKANLPEKTLEVLCSSSGKDPEAIRDLFNNPRALLIPVNPFKLDERLAVQQGVFVASLDITKPFMTILNSLESSENYESNVRKLELIGSNHFLRDTLSELQRMNITRLSLFPGIDGLAQSLENLIVMPDRFAAEEI
jgi:FRG domain